MTRVVGKGSCDPCCTDWKQKINELWENYQEVVKGIKAGPDTVYPDGNGIVDIDGAIENEVARQISDESLITSEDLQTAIADMATIQDLDSGLSTLQSTKQDKLVNQVNIKSVNGVSLLGSGDIPISADSVAWDDITDKPDFAEVATSGSYEDLTDKPTIPEAQINADWDAVEGVAEILHKPTIPSGADLVPSTSGITDGYVLTNDNGTPAWKAGGGGGSGMTAHTYATWNALAADLIAHPEALFNYLEPASSTGYMRFAKPFSTYAVFYFKSVLYVGGNMVFESAYTRSDSFDTNITTFNSSGRSLTYASSTGTWSMSQPFEEWKIEKAYLYY